MHSSIQNRIGMVFVPVQDMQRAIGWYSKLLGLPVGQTSHGDNIYTVPMSGDTSLILDSHKPVGNSSQPLCCFWTEDIRRANEFLLSLNVDILTAIEDIGSVSILTFRDPDQNLLMVCQANQQ